MIDPEEFKEQIENTDVALPWKIPKRELTPGAAARRRRQVEFLKAYEATGSIKRSCEIAQVNVKTHQSWLVIDPWYKPHFMQAAENYAESVQDEVHDRAMHGVEVPIVGKRPVVIGTKANGDPLVAMQDEIIGYKTFKSDLLLMFHAKRYIPQYKDTYQEPEAHDAAIESVSPITRIAAKLDEMEARKVIELVPIEDMKALPPGETIEGETIPNEET